MDTLDRLEKMTDKLIEAYNQQKEALKKMQTLQDKEEILARIEKLIEKIEGAGIELP